MHISHLYLGWIKGSFMHSRQGLKPSALAASMYPGGASSKHLPINPPARRVCDATAPRLAVGSGALSGPKFPMPAARSSAVNADVFDVDVMVDVSSSLLYALLHGNTRKEEIASCVGLFTS